MRKAARQWTSERCDDWVKRNLIMYTERLKASKCEKVLLRALPDRFVEQSVYLIPGSVNYLILGTSTRRTCRCMRVNVRTKKD